MRAFIRTLLCIACVATSATGFAASNADLNALLDKSSAQSSDNTFLPVDQAFVFSATALDAGHVKLSWIINACCYLYQSRIAVSSTDAGVNVGAPQFPAGIDEIDQYFGKQTIYRDSLMVSVPVSHTAGTVNLAVRYQGCATAGICYPPQTHQVAVQMPTGGATTSASGSAAAPAAATYVSQQDRLADVLAHGSLLQALMLFFGGGILLAFTPCVLPMVPILSGLIVGQGERVTTARAFSLSVTYVLGMALTYTITGAAFAAAGKQVQAVFQQPWILGLFAAFFVAMAASMFGLFTVQMPGFIQTRLADVSNQQRAGTYGGVAVMGMLSALIVTTCVGPVLVAALVVIGETGNVGRGASALFAMGIGMGVPLIVVGTSAGRWLPRAGAWMDGIKQLFGVMMLALACWMLSRVVSDRVTLALFALPAIAAALVLWRLRLGIGSLWIARAAGVACAVYAAALLFGSAQGHDDLLRPLARTAPTVDEPAFERVSSVAQLRADIQQASAQHRPVMLDFTADWCTSCKEMQRYTFSDPKVREAMRSVRLLRADVTANNTDDQALLQELGIIGPPTIAFYDADGHEQHAYRVVGYMEAAKFAAVLQRAVGAG